MLCSFFVCVSISGEDGPMISYAVNKNLSVGVKIMNSKSLGFFLRYLLSRRDSFGFVLSCIAETSTILVRWSISAIEILTSVSPWLVVLERKLQKMGGNQISLYFAALRVKKNSEERWIARHALLLL